MSVHQLPDGRWFVRFVKGTLTGKPNATREYFGRGPDAELQARSRNRQLGLGLQPLEDGRTFQDLALYYLEAKVDRLAETSFRSAYMHIARHLVPHFGTSDVTRITEELIDQYVRQRRRETWTKAGGRGESVVGVSMSTIKRELTTLQAVLNFAARRKVILHNPVLHYDMPREDGTVIAEATQAELEAILRVAQPHLRRYILIAYYTALRPGYTELLTMRWDQVDLAGATIFVRSAKKGGLEQRRIGMHPALRALVEEWFAEDQALASMPEYIVHYHGAHIKTIGTAWKKAKKRAKILRRLRTYDIRHASITAMLEAGGDLKAVSMAAGHRNPAMTMNKYQHVSTRLQDAAVAGLVTLVTGGNTTGEQANKKNAVKSS